MLVAIFLVGVDLTEFLGLTCGELLALVLPSGAVGSSKSVLIVTLLAVLIVCSIPL